MASILSLNNFGPIYQNKVNLVLKRIYSNQDEIAPWRSSRHFS